MDKKCIFCGKINNREKSKYCSESCKNKVWYLKNKRKRIDSSNEYYQQNKDEIREKRREYDIEYRKKNKKRIEKLSSDYRKNNKETIADKSREEYRKNKDKYKNISKKYYRCNKEKHNKYMKKYSRVNKKKINDKNKQRYRTDINFKLTVILRKRLYGALKNNQKIGSAIKDLGCSIEDFKQYLESKWLQGMSWDNWTIDGWHIDHIRPLNDFNLEDREELLKACHYSNLQPMWAEDNLKKGAK